MILFVLLFYAASGSSHEDEDLLDTGTGGRAYSKVVERGPEVLQRVFSKEDLVFVANFSSAALLRIFRKERKAIAIQWVKQTSTEISQVMREHTRDARNSANLKVAVELQTLWRFTGLRILCGLLVVLMKFVDLHMLWQIANRAGKLREKLLASQPGLNAGSTAVTSRTINAL